MDDPLLAPEDVVSDAGHEILVIDADERAARLLAEALRETGLAVLSSTSLGEAVHRIATQPLDVVVVDTSLGLGGVRELLEVLEERGPTAPGCVVLSNSRDPALNLELFQAGIEEFIRKPLLLREVVARIRLVRDRVRARRDVDLTRDHTGRVDPQTLIELMRGIERGGRSGGVRFSSGGLVGTLWFRDGAPWDARAGRDAGEPAFQRLFTWNHGVWELRFAEEVERDRTLTRSWDELLQDAVLHEAEFSRRAGDVGDLRRVFTVDYRSFATRIGALPKATNTVIRMFDGFRTLAEAVALAGVDDLEALDVVAALLEHDILHPLDAQPLHDPDADFENLAPAAAEAPPAGAPVGDLSAFELRAERLRQEAADLARTLRGETQSMDSADLRQAERGLAAPVSRHAPAAPPPRGVAPHAPESKPSTPETPPAASADEPVPMMASPWAAGTPGRPGKRRRHDTASFAAHRSGAFAAADVDGPAETARAGMPRIVEGGPQEAPAAGPAETARAGMPRMLAQAAEDDAQEQQRASARTRTPMGAPAVAAAERLPEADDEPRKPQPAPAEPSSPPPDTDAAPSSAESAGESRNATDVTPPATADREDPPERTERPREPSVVVSMDLPALRPGETAPMAGKLSAGRPDAGLRRSSNTDTGDYFEAVEPQRVSPLLWVVIAVMLLGGITVWVVSSDEQPSTARQQATAVAPTAPVQPPSTRNDAALTVASAEPGQPGDDPPADQAEADQEAATMAEAMVIGEDVEALARDLATDAEPAAHADPAEVDPAPANIPPQASEAPVRPRPVTDAVPAPRATPAPAPAPARTQARTPSAPTPPAPAPPAAAPPASPAVSSVARSAPDPADALAACNAASRARDWSLALSRCEEAVRLDSRNANALVLLAEATQNLDDPRRAASLLERAVRLDRRNARAWLNLGVARQELGDRTGALDAYGRFVDLAPNTRRAEEIRTVMETLR